MLSRNILIFSNISAIYFLILLLLNQVNFPSLGYTFFLLSVTKFCSQGIACFSSNIAGSLSHNILPLEVTFVIVIFLGYFFNLLIDKVKENDEKIPDV